MDGDHCDLWIDGFPRSANTFAVQAFRMANPTARIASHHHIPTFIIHALNQDKPGIFLIRKPEESAVSWAIYWKWHLKECLDYYIDYHRTLLPHIPDLFIAPFEVTTTRFDRVIDGFNQTFGTSYASFKHDPAAISDCFSRIEKLSALEADGSVNEFAVCRPSPRRDELKPKMLQELRNSPLLMRKLEDADAVYAAFCNAPSRLALPDTPTPQPLGSSKQFHRLSRPVPVASSGSFS